MCGIAGLWDPQSSIERNEKLVRDMTRVMAARGPDGEGIWKEDSSSVILGHKRLSVVDLSVEGKQPMTSESGRYVLSYNGEIYNCDELRKILGRDLPSFRGHSDTEVALALIEKKGFLGALKEFNGMFAMALWDRETKSLSLARDRMGIKPLIYGKLGKGLLFASTSNSLREHPGFDRAISAEALNAYLRGSCIPAPLSIHRHAQKLMPGTLIHFATPLSEGKVECYWDAKAVSMSGQLNPLSQSPSEIIDSLDSLLSASVKRRMISDVPLGAFLSGGVDSSTVVALMAKHSNQPIKTFTIGTQESSHNEADIAKKVSEHLGTQHHELVVRPEHVLGVIENIVSFYDEPFADSSQIPTYLVSKLAREKVTVSLSGDGGDELFGGYNRHLWGPRVSRINQVVPLFLRKIISSGLNNISPDSLNKIYQKFIPKIGSMKMQLPADKAIKFAQAVSSKSEEEMYALLAHGNADPSLLLNDSFVRSSLEKRAPDLPDLAHRFMFRDQTGYLPDDILTKVDRASMAVSLEARVPLLDHKVVEFAWRIPLHLKIAEGQGKWVLRQVLKKYVPLSLIDQPKSGFGIPIGEWMRGPLRTWTQDLLSESNLAKYDYFDRPAISNIVREHMAGEREHAPKLWSLLMLSSWLESEL